MSSSNRKIHHARRTPHIHPARALSHLTTTLFLTRSVLFTRRNRRRLPVVGSTSSSKIIRRMILLLSTAAGISRCVPVTCRSPSPVHASTALACPSPELMLLVVGSLLLDASTPKPRSMALVWQQEPSTILVSDVCILVAAPSSLHTLVSVHPASALSATFFTPPYTSISLDAPQLVSVMEWTQSINAQINAGALSYGVHTGVVPPSWSK